MCPYLAMSHISLAADVETIITTAEETGLHLNRNKCEIIAYDFNIVSSFNVSDQQIGNRHMAEVEKLE